MLYSKFIFNAKEKTINQLDNGTWYLEPEWKDILGRDIKNISELEESYISDWADVKDILQLEVIKRNAEASKKNDVIDWIYETISGTLEPEMLEEETELLKDMIEYRKQKNNIVPFPTE